MDLVYVVSRWGEPTQTFVRREAEAVAEMGTRVRALSIKPVGPAASTIDAAHLPLRKVIWWFLRATARRPVCVVSGAAKVLRRSAPRNVPAHLTAFAVGSAWAASGAIGSSSLHAHFGWVAATAAWSAARWSGRPFSVVLHAFELHDRRYLDDFTPEVLRSARTVFVISERDRELVRARWGIAAQLLRMGVSEDWLEPIERHLTDSVLSTGSLVPKKGHDVLIRAMVAVPADLRLIIVGQGPLRWELERLIRELGLERRVVLAGARSPGEIRRLLDSARVFALASNLTPSGDRDGIPVALIEAMARGVPVVSTTVGAIPELVDGAGVLVDPGDVGALAHAITELSDPVRNRRCGESCRRRVEEGWTAARSAAVVTAAHSCGTG